MAKGKFKAKAESQRITATVEELSARIKQLTEENEKLNQQAVQDSLHHAYQIAEMYEQTTAVTSPRIQELEEEVLRLKKALRGL
jgi:hypothetical protein